MEKIVRLVLDRASNGMMDKQTAAQILSLLKTEEIKPRQEIAVIGVAAHLPRVDNLDQFWEAVMNQVDFIGDVPDQRKADLDDYLAYADHIFGDQMKYLSGAYLEDIDKFDPQLFRLSPREASLMDPHQRLFLQVAWRVIEDAGYAGGKISGSKTGVYVGFASNAKDNYQKMIFDVDSGLMSSAGVGNVTAMLPSRISYLLDLKGPSMVIDTACSSALIAVHTACQAIRNGDCEMAIAGSVRMNLLPVDQDFLKFGLESSDGKTRTFDDKSDGAGMGEGVIAVLLKPLDKAVRDKDHIYAVIKGNAVNQDGTSIGLTAPNPEAQKDVILKAWDHAGIHPETLSYIESHGTGTVLGDPIELDGLERAFREHTDKKQFCAIGSLKTNLGHLFESAGLAGFVKCMLMFKHRKIPPMLFFERPNARVDFSQLPVYVNNKPSEWRASGSGTPLRCGISSFGFSGTNCHMVLEEPPTPQEEAAENIGPFLCVLSAKTQSALMRSVHNLLAHLERHHPAIQDVGYTLATGRNHFNCRLALIAVDTAELVSQLRGIAVSGFASSRLEGVQWGEYKVVPSNKANLAETEMYEKDQRVLTESATLVTDSVSPGLRLPLERISELYVRGADIPWELVYRFSGARKVSLPGYAFERNRCWLDIPKGVGKAAANRVESGGEDRFYALKWESLPFVTADEPSLSEGVALVLSDGNPMSGLLASRFRERGMDVLEAEFGDRFEQKTEWHYVIRGDEEEFIRLLEPHASKLRRVVQAIGFGASPDSLEELERIQHIGTYSLFQLARAVAKLEIAQEMDIVLLTETAVKVTGEEACIRPEQATLAGLGKVVRKEHANLICRNVDIDPDTPAVRIAEEIDCMQQEIYRIAYRLGQRYAEKLEAVDMAAVPEKPVELRENGVYVVTGGLGGIGLEVAKYLAARQKVRLMMINRTPMPDRREWAGLMESGEDVEACRKIEAIRQIEELGAQVDCFSADVADLPRMREVIGEIQARHGAIHGVIHGAGVGGAELITNRKAEDFQAVFSPKVHGTWILGELTRNERLDFFVLFSSIATVLSAPGQGDYIAANAYLDAFAQSRSNRGERTLAINWSTWRETGMSVKHNFTVDTLFKSMSTKNAIEGFDDAFHRDISNVLIGEIQYESKMITLIEKFHFQLSDKIKGRLEQKKSKMKKPTALNSTVAGDIVLTGRNSGQYSPAEKQLGDIWGRLLGFENIDIYDNFFELGGDSIIGVKIVNLIYRQFGVEIGVAELFNYLTINDLAGYVSDRTSIPAAESAEQTEDNQLASSGYPVSTAQRQMFTYQRVYPDSLAYNVTRAISIHGQLDLEKLKLVLHGLLQLHEALRTTIKVVDGELRQFISDSADLPIERLACTESDIVPTILRWRRPFRLDELPLIRVAVIRITDDRCALAFDMHHVLTDGVSMDILVRDFMQLYEGIQVLPPSASYKMFASWQQTYMKSNQCEADKHYWLDMYRDGVPEQTMPVDFVRQGPLSGAGMTVTAVLNDQSRQKLFQYTKSTSTTPFMLMMTAYQLVLAQYSYREDVVTGTPVAGRPGTPFEEIVGMFINMLPIRTLPKRHLTLKEYSEQVKTTLLEAFRHQNYPFDELAASLQAGTDRKLLNNVFIYQNVGKSEIAMSDMMVTPIVLDDASVSYDMTLEAIDKSGQLQLNLKFSTDLYRPETMRQLLSDYEDLLMAVIDYPNRTIGDALFTRAHEQQTTEGMKELDVDFLF